ncbi:MAG: hypothetical protein ACETWK_08630 [Candidatus Aminicenantaceae bacterium]
MRCKQIKETFPDFLIGDIAQTAKVEVQKHIATCTSCREELESLSAIWTKLGVLPEEEPSKALRSRFYAMLEAYKQGLEKEKTKLRFSNLFGDWLERWWPRRPAFQFTLAVMLLVVGLAFGYFLTSGGQSNAEIAHLRQEVDSMRQLAAVSLLNQQSPSQRLKGVSWSSRVEQPNDETLRTLLRTLNSDQNINVRLATIDALYLFRDHPMVRQGLIQSLSQQTSPLVQVALIDLILEIRERQAIDALRQLIKDEKLNPDVKQRVELGIQQLS